MEGVHGLVELVTDELLRGTGIGHVVLAQRIVKRQLQLHVGGHDQLRRGDAQQVDVTAAGFPRSVVRQMRRHR